MQRIESGRLRGRRLLPLPKGVAGLRPTGARVRGAIFDRLGDAIIDARVLDLFAGSGALSIEALSRGAATATLIEVSGKVVRHLGRQLEELDLASQARVIRGDATRILDGSPLGRFDLVVVDPPFATPGVFGPIARTLCEGWLAPEAIVVCERERVRGTTPVVDWPDALELEAERVYGQAAVEFLRYAEPRGDLNDE